MFKFSFDIPGSKEKINLKDPILLIGSCFSNEVGEKLSQAKFKTISNPFGTIYNPHSIFKLLENDSDKLNVIESQGVYYHWDAHGAISGLTEEETSKRFENQVNQTQNFLKQARWLIITLGTAIIYEIDDKKIVANCHKVPAKYFKKRFLTQKEIISKFESLHAYLKDINPKLQIIFTVSPVRHIKDGLVDNNRSKAILIDSIHQIVDQHDSISYFPSYEILIDELRDYRFYTEDMIHPSTQAIEYVWNRFVDTYCDEVTVKFLEEWKQIQSAINHRPFQPHSISHQSFLKTTLKKLEKLNEKVDVSVEIKQVKSQII
ncbi:GSCFA domain-containing protein [Ekhidna sp.]|uniref:GSCFA domain-containing protein n=1 Tax=Ekhidna sp. TaxID=2608089 RepID=UPI003CCBC2C3